MWGGSPRVGNLGDHHPLRRLIDPVGENQIAGQDVGDLPAFGIDAEIIRREKRIRREFMRPIEQPPLLPS